MVAAGDLRHLPGSYGLPVVGHTLRMIRDAERWAGEGLDRYGPIFRTNFMFEPWVVAADPDVARTVLLDRDQIFSSRDGWRSTIGRLFARGLMLRDFEDHRLHRRGMQDAFRREALRSYVELMNPIIAERIDSWATHTELQVYPALKQLTLDIAARVFVGLPPGAEADRLNQAFTRTVAAAVAPVRRELPGTAFRAGMRARRWLEDFFATRIPHRRRTAAPDLFTRLCQAVDEDGRRFRDDEIVDHMIFLLMAAHDTTTSTLATMVWELARRPQLQQAVRQEAAGLGESALAWKHRDRLVLTDAVFREAMRLHPPVPFIPRRTTVATDIGGHPVPAGTPVSVAVLLIHRLPELWTQPAEFDPDRFSPGRAEDKHHSHGFIPFGGGAHTCIGRHFAQLMTAAIMIQLLQRLRIAARPGQQVHIQTLPIPKPRGGLPLLLEPIG